jgi:hypothetical protein
MRGRCRLFFLRSLQYPPTSEQILRESAGPRALLDDIPACAVTFNPEKEIPMSITVEEKARLIKEYATKEGDTGSPEVQVAILSSRTSRPTRRTTTRVVAF